MTAEYFLQSAIVRFSMSAIIYWQNPCKLPMSFRCIKAYMLAFSGRFSRKCLEGISFNFFVCFISDRSIGSAPMKKTSISIVIPELKQNPSLLQISCQCLNTNSTRMPLYLYLKHYLYYQYYLNYQYHLYFPIS